MQVAALLDPSLGGGRAGSIAQKGRSMRAALAWSGRRGARTQLLKLVQPDSLSR
jgi:hypothetical protein